LVEFLTDIGGLAADLGRGIAIFIDEMQDLGPDDISALCAACHEISQASLPVIVVGAGLPHLPAVLSASKSYSERLFRYARIDRLERDAADAALVVPAAGGGRRVREDALAEMYAVTGGYPYFIQAYGKEVWDLAPGDARSPPTMCASQSLEAEAEFAVGFFGSRYERATPAERDYLRAMAGALVDRTGRCVGQATESERSGLHGIRLAELDSTCPRPTSRWLGKQPQSLSPRPRRAAEEGPDLLDRAWPHRLHRPPLRPLPARPPLTAVVVMSVNGERF
jgi:hypothetical protein